MSKQEVVCGPQFERDFLERPTSLDDNDDENKVDSSTSSSNVYTTIVSRSIFSPTPSDRRTRNINTNNNSNGRIVIPTLFENYDYERRASLKKLKTKKKEKETPLAKKNSLTSSLNKLYSSTANSTTSSSTSSTPTNDGTNTTTISLSQSLSDLYGRFTKTWSSLDMAKRKSRVYKTTRRLPIGSIIALAVSWIGLAVFCTKTYSCAEEIEVLSRDLFAFLQPWIEKLKLGIIILGAFMACVTFAMTLVGFLATHHCHCSYKNKPSHCLCSNFGGRLTCALFWILSYLLNLCWLGILSATVVMTAAYLAFLPVCLPQAGREDNYCFNFTLFSLMISGGKDANAVSLILCGGPIDKFCKLSKAVMPFFWGSYFGCVAVLLGISHFNGSLAANFAHGKHAIRYRKLRKGTGSPLTLYNTSWTPNSLYDNVNNNNNNAKTHKTDNDNSNKCMDDTCIPNGVHHDKCHNDTKDQTV